MVSVLTVAHVGCPGWWQRAYEGSYVSDILGVHQPVTIGEMLHSQVPTTIVSVIDQLSDDDLRVLRGDGRYIAVLPAATVGAVAGDTSVVIERLTVHPVGSGMVRGLVFLLIVAYGECQQRQRH